MTRIYLFLFLAGDTICIERVSPEVIILRPPEKLVIEVRVSGEYELLFWYKGSIGTFIPGLMIPQEFPNYFETFVRDNTTAGDEGYYIVQPQFKPGTSQSHSVTPPVVEFGVISPGMSLIIVMNQLIYAFIISHAVDATTTSLSTSTVVIPEGGSADISCRSVGAPVPSITWEFNNQTTDFEQTDTETPFAAALTGTIGNRGFDVTPGNIESSLHIVSATYPDHDGVYTCIGTNSDDLTIASSRVFITVQVNGELHKNQLYLCSVILMQLSLRLRSILLILLSALEAMSPSPASYLGEIPLFTCTQLLTLARAVQQLDQPVF